METQVNIEKLRGKLAKYLREENISIAKMSRESKIDYLTLFRFVNGITKTPSIEHLNTMIKFINNGRKAA